MSLSAWEKQALDSIEGGLAGSAAELGGGKLHRDARRLRLGRERAWPLALWLVVSLGMIAVALVLSRGGPAACTQPWGVCAWPPAGHSASTEYGRWSDNPAGSSQHP